ncbi:hypothetical protein VTH06DRAFT_3345 [Thermothelomyces fergusii]
MANLPDSQAEEPYPLFDDDFFNEPTTPMSSQAPMPPPPPPPPPPKPARQPLQSADANVVLSPPPPPPSAKRSPLKSNNARPSSAAPPAPVNPSQGSKLNTVQMMPPSNAPPSTDSLEKKQPVMSRFKTVAKKPQPDPSAQLASKDNSHPPIYPAPSPSQFNLDLENYYQKPSGKRTLMEAAPIKEIRPAKKQKVDDPLPPPDSFPPIIDDGTKPNHSYATLIAMAIIRSPQRRLTLSQIYKWISDTFSYYRGDNTGWQNSIRHNLSLNKSFVKQERPKDDPGKGSYWSIEPGTEHTVLKEKPSRKSAAPTAENMPVMSTRLEPSQPQQQQQQQQHQQRQQHHQQHHHHQQQQQQHQHQQQPQQQQQQQLQLQLQPSCIPEPMLPQPPAAPQGLLPALPPQPSQQLAPAPPLPEISSDATIPASDAATIEEVVCGPSEKDLQHEPELYSPLPAALHSSPPIPRRLEPRHSGTPPSQQRVQQQSSATKSRHRRRFMSMDDSGYISSLESSAMRPNQHAKLLTSEADRPRIKRGRAEEEIARLRASSYDSPTKSRSHGYAPPPSSSPIRQTSSSGNGQMLPPLTPAMKLKAPPKPPPSVSPSTNLRLHRENIQSMVDSPYRRVTELLPEGDVESAAQQTPGLHGDHLWYYLEHSGDSNSGFDIFEDPADFQNLFALTPTVTHTGSPTKRSVRKQRAERSQSSSATSNAANSAPGTSKANSFLKIPNQTPNLELETPSKVFDGLPSSPSKAFIDMQSSPSKMPLINDENLDVFQGVNFSGLDAPDFLEENDFSGIDMLAGFEKIGSNSAQASRNTHGSKGTLNRSHTSMF